MDPNTLINMDQDYLPSRFQSGINVRYDIPLHYEKKLTDGFVDSQFKLNATTWLPYNSTDPNYLAFERRLQVEYELSFYYF